MQRAFNTFEVWHPLCYLLPVLMMELQDLPLLSLSFSPSLSLPIFPPTLHRPCQSSSSTRYPKTLRRKASFPIKTALKSYVGLAWKRRFPPAMLAYQPFSLGPDAHRSNYSWEWLLASTAREPLGVSLAQEWVLHPPCENVYGSRCPTLTIHRRDPILWDASIASQPPEVDFDDVMNPLKKTGMPSLTHKIVSSAGNHARAFQTLNR